MQRQFQQDLNGTLGEITVHGPSLLEREEWLRQTELRLESLDQTKQATQAKQVAQVTQKSTQKSHEVVLRLLGALALPIVAIAFALCIDSSQLIPSFRIRPFALADVPIVDTPLAIPFLTGLAIVGFQAVARRRAKAALLSAALGGLIAFPLLLAFALAQGTVMGWLLKINPFDSWYLRYTLFLAPIAGFLFFAWTMVWKTTPRRGAIGGGAFALITYALFQLRDCFIQPSLWPQLLSFLPNAFLCFVVPGMFLGWCAALFGVLVRKRRKKRQPSDGLY
jgi:hypothetical protein